MGSPLVNRMNISFLNVLDHAGLKEVCEALQTDQPFSLNITPSAQLKAVPMTAMGRFWHRNDSDYHKTRLLPLAVLFTKILEKQDRQSLVDADQDPYIRAARNLHRTIRSYHLADPRFQQLRKQIVAAKLGIEADTFDHNPGFQKFVEEHHLERYILEYRDEVKVNPSTKEVSIRFTGAYTPWKKVSEALQQWPEFTTQPQQAWVYGNEGIIHKNLYDWSTLTPFKKGNPADWNHQYIYEFCTCYNPATLKTGNHAWIRLKTPEGDIYSIGLYRPGKTGPSDNFKFPLRIKPGYLMQPDFSEFWDYEILTIPVAITKNDFLEMKRVIEEDKKNDDMVFQLFNNNCGLYCKKIALIAGINLPTSERIIELITPITWQNRVKHVLSYFPQPVVKMMDIVQTFFFNLLAVALGATMIDAHLTPKRKIKAQAHLQSFWDLFKPEKASLNHPLTIAFKTKPLIDHWREKKIAKLSESAKTKDGWIEKFSTIQFGIPKKFRISPIKM